jgi:hypothetical protein
MHRKKTKLRIRLSPNPARSVSEKSIKDISDVSVTSGTSSIYLGDHFVFCKASSVIFNNFGLNETCTSPCCFRVTATIQQHSTTAILVVTGTPNLHWFTSGTEEPENNRAKHSAEIYSNTFHFVDTKLILHFQTMSLLKGMKFSEATWLTDTHDEVQGRDGNATWVNDFKPTVRGSGKLMAEALLWLCYNLVLCCAILGESAMHIRVN